MINIFFTNVVTIIIFTSQLLLSQSAFSSDAKCVQSIDFLQDHCFTCNNEKAETKCKVEEFKYLGKVNNQYYYSSITLEYHSESGMDLNEEYNTRNVTIYEGKNKKEVRPVYYTGGSFDIFEHVFIELVTAKKNNFIHIYVSDGNGGFDSGEFFVFKNNSWYKIKVPDLDSEFEHVIPKNCSFNSNGGWIDLNTLTFNRSVYKENEPSCCPTGGKLIAYLKLTSDNKFFVTKTKYFPNSN